MVLILHSSGWKGSEGCKIKH